MQGHWLANQIANAVIILFLILAAVLILRTVVMVSMLLLSPLSSVWRRLRRKGDVSGATESL